MRCILHKHNHCKLSRCIAHPHIVHISRPPLRKDCWLSRHSCSPKLMFQGSTKGSMQHTTLPATLPQTLPIKQARLPTWAAAHEPDTPGAPISEPNAASHRNKTIPILLAG